MFSKFRRLPKSLESFVEKHPFVCVVIVIAYIASPIDVLPEMFFGPLGSFDDALVGITAVSLIKRAAKARAEHRRLNPPAPKVLPPKERAALPPAEQNPRQERQGHWRGGRRDEGNRGNRRPNDRRPNDRRPDRSRDDRPRGERAPGDRRP